MTTDWASEIRRVIAKFDPDQPRGEGGRWSSGGGSPSYDSGYAGGSHSYAGTMPKTNSGKTVSMDKHPRDYKVFTEQDHKEAAELHRGEAARLADVHDEIAARPVESWHRPGDEENPDKPNMRWAESRREHRLSDVRDDMQEHEARARQHTAWSKDAESRAARDKK